MRITELPEVVALLACPHCGESLTVASNSALRCSAGHAFDVAREGYVSLLAGNALTSSADTPDMIAARESFLSAGHYAPVRDAVAQLLERTLAEATPGAILEVGAGTGYYLAGVLDVQSQRRGLALDTSKPALRRAARIHERAGAVACDVWGTIPVQDATVAAVLDIFAPRNITEIARVLAPGGVLVVVTPRSGHLGELVEPLGFLSVDDRKADRLEEQLAGRFVPAESMVVEQVLVLSHAAVGDLAGMGPSAHHTDRIAFAGRIAVLSEPCPVTMSVNVSAYRAL